jgi:hypothetical protein
MLIKSLSVALFLLSRHAREDLTCSTSSDQRLDAFLLFECLQACANMGLHGETVVALTEAIALSPGTDMPTLDKVITQIASSQMCSIHTCLCISMNARHDRKHCAYSESSSAL